MIFPPAQLPLPAMPGLVCVCVGIMSRARLGQLPELVLPDLYETLLLCLGLQEAFWAEVFFFARETWLLCSTNSVETHHPRQGSAGLFPHLH